MKQVGDRQILSVADVNALAKEVLEALSFWVQGEVYDFKSADARYYYIYFQLKDQSGAMVLPTIMLPRTFNQLDFTFANGQKVLVHGKLTLFTKSGKYQFLVDAVEPAGQGQLAQELERLKAKLQQEGLFDQSRKRPLPQYSQRVGVITSAASDAWADFQRHSVAKFPLIQITLADVFVQGPKAVPSILRALQAMQSLQLEVIVITRGGGSLEDLSAFNDERVVRAIADSRIPTLVAVGHEKDVSIADLVADLRASTPTNAGQLLTYAYEQAQNSLQHQQLALRRYALDTLASSGHALDQAMRHLHHIQHKYQSLPYRLSEIKARLTGYQSAVLVENQSRLLAGKSSLRQAGQDICRSAAGRLNFAHRQLMAVSPLAVLERGYSLVEVNGEIVRSTRQVKQGDTMNVRLHRGSLRGLVTRVEDNHGG